ncbi:MAG: flagellar biosynthesis anti-sigma factor FlgM [Planctomycetota bacterium]|nr:MAG: flagellar biosynthesis anti-sigma factor FlgM [Planctomycetota bacterium]
MKIPPNLPPQQVKGASKAYGNQTADATSSDKTKSDSVSVSSEAQFLNALSKVPDVREAKIAEIKQAIDNGSYVSDDNLDKALDNLLEDLF